jgi:hypothetical protein
MKKTKTPRKANDGNGRPAVKARWTDPKTSYEASTTADISRLAQKVADVIREAGGHGATWDEVCAVLERVRPGSISPRFRELRLHGVIRTKTTSEGDRVTRSGETGFGQQVYVIRKEHEPFDDLESELDELLDPDQHGKHCLHCVLMKTIVAFNDRHPERYFDDTLAALAGVIGDLLAADQSRLSHDIRDIKTWIKQRIKHVASTRERPTSIKSRGSATGRDRGSSGDKQSRSG